jgi:hypothetical protein
MSTSEEHNWEDHWRKEVQGHAPLASTEDWRGMAQQLEQGSPSHVQHLIEQEPIGFDPWRSIKKIFPRLGWPIWAGLLLLVSAIGLWLGSINGEIVHQEIKAIIMARDSFPPKYALNRYWTYDEEGNRVGEMHSDTVWLDHQVRKQGPHVLLSPGKVSDYRIDTLLHISAQGDILSIRYDTVAPPSRGKAVYRFDTIYQLDTLGNLTGHIHRIDTTISYLTPGGI